MFYAKKIDIGTSECLAIKNVLRMQGGHKTFSFFTISFSPLRYLIYSQFCLIWTLLLYIWKTDKFAWLFVYVSLNLVTLGFDLIDYSTRYPEAVPLKKITTEAVTETLLDIYSRVGIPEEVLTDQGTQFMSECMQEVSRPLSIKGLTSTPYHPICNGLVERWNGTLKSMLKRLCQDQAKQWHRLKNPVLFHLKRSSPGVDRF